MRSTISAIKRRLGAAHGALAVVTLLAAGWLQSDFAPSPWWQGPSEWLGPLSECIVAWRFAAVGYLLLTVLVEWRMGVALRGAANLPRSSALIVLALHGSVFIAVAAAIARGPLSRALLADLDEWLAVVGVVALLAVVLQMAGLTSTRERWRDPTGIAVGQSSPARGLTIVVWALGAITLFLVIATIVIETRSLPHTVSSQP